MLEQSPALPRSAQGRQQVAVQADPTSNLPTEDQEDSETEQYRVGARGACQLEVEVHQRPEEGRDADECPDDQSDSDKELTNRNDFGEPGVPLVVEHVLEEVLKPRVRAGRRGRPTFGNRCRALPVALERRAALHPGIV